MSQCCTLGEVERVLAVVFLAASAQGQDPQPAPIVVTVNEVVVPVIVTDKKGHSINGLKAGDFQIFEEDAQKPVATFSTRMARVAGAALAAEAAPAPQQRPGVTAIENTFVVCIDVLHTSLGSITRIQTALDKFLRTLQSSSKSRLVLVTIGPQLRVLQVGTADVEAILKTLHASNLLAGSAAAGPQGFSTEVDAIKKQMEAYCKRCPCGRSAVDRANTCRIEQYRMRDTLTAISERWERLDNAFLGQLKAVLEEMAKLPGERRMVFASDGFSLKPGKELFSIMSAYLPSSSVFRGEPPAQLQPALDESMRLAATRDIRVYTVDSRGVSSPSFQTGGISDASTGQVGGARGASRGGTLLQELDSKGASVAWDNASGLEQLAKATGGIFLHESNDLSASVRTAYQDDREYYLLSFAGSPTQSDKREFRRIRIEVNRKGVIVRAKSGYWVEPVKPN